MPGKIGVVVIHGVGSQRQGFSAGLTDELSNRLKDASSRVVWQEIHWAPVLLDREETLWTWMNKAKEPDGSRIELDWARTRKFLVHNVGDAFAYHRDSHAASAYADLHGVVSDSLRTLKASLKDPHAPVVVVAHSLGAHIMSNYIWDRQHWSGGGSDPLQNIPTLTAMVTFGCNIPLFSLSFDVAKPINLPGTGVTKPALRAAARWLNFLDRDDVLGWPLKPLYQKNSAKLTQAQRATVAKIRDYEINVGGLGTNWNPASHNGYWTDNDFTRPVAAYLKRLLAAA